MKVGNEEMCVVSRGLSFAVASGTSSTRLALGDVGTLAINIGYMNDGVGNHSYTHTGSEVISAGRSKMSTMGNTQHFRRARIFFSSSLLPAAQVDETPTLAQRRSRYRKNNGSSAGTQSINSSNSIAKTITTLVHHKLLRTPSI